MNRKTTLRHIISAAAAIVMCLSYAPVMPAQNVSVSAADAGTFDLDELKDNGIPVLNINIDESAEGYGTIKEMNESEDHSVECTGSLKLDVPDGYTGDYSSKELKDTDDLKIEYIRGRGNSTWGQYKNPYKIKLDKGADLLGMGKNKHWVLLANATDDTMLRNRIASYIGDRLGLAYTPQMLPVDVVMNGDYLGSYFLSEQVRVGKSRVEIDELTSDDNKEPEVTGGYLLSWGWQEQKDSSKPEYRFITTKNGEKYFCESTDFYEGYSDDKTGTEAQFEYISDYLQKIEDAVLSDDFKDKDGVDISEYLDLESAASYWWVNNFIKNYDAFGTSSTYLYKERSGKLFYGPLWDHDQSMGGSSPEGFNKQNTLWLNRLRAYNTDYQKILFEKWTQLDNIITDIIKEGGVIDKYVSEMYPSEQDNEKRWDISSIEGDDFDYKKKVEELRSWLAERQQWVRDNVNDELTKARCKITLINDDQVMTVMEEDYLHEVIRLPSPPVKDGYVFTGWVTADGNSDYFTPAITEDTTLYASYIPDEEAVLAEHIFFELPEKWVSINDLPYDASMLYITVPGEPQEKNYTWTSSDTSVASVDNDGRVTVQGEGDTTVSVKLKNGETGQYTLHVYDPSVAPMQKITSIKCDTDTITLKAGEYSQVSVYALPTPNEDPFLSYETDDTDVIELLEYGAFKALAPGEATITVTTLDDQVTTCKIIVTADSAEEDPGQDNDTGKHDDPGQDTDTGEEELSEPETDTTGQDTDDPEQETDDKDIVNDDTPSVDNDNDTEPDNSTDADKSADNKAKTTGDGNTNSADENKTSAPVSSGSNSSNPKTGAAAGTAYAAALAASAALIRKKNK